MLDGWVRFGWQGMSAEMPADWELAGAPKTHDPWEGYLRLDDANQPRLELKWSKAQRKFNLDKTANQYLKGVQKTYRKQIGNIEIRRDRRLIPKSGKYAAFYENKEALFFSWKGGYRAFGAVMRCEHCCRAVMIQAIGPPSGENLRQTASRIFSSFRDHPENGLNLWTAYGFEVETPRRFRLEKTQFMNGYILMSFTDGSRRIAVERYGLADALLENASLDDWFRGAYRKEIKGSVLAADPVEEMGGVYRLWDVRFPKPWERSYRRPTTRGYFWNDETTNRIYVARATGKGPLERWIRPIAESMRG